MLSGMSLAYITMNTNIIGDYFGRYNMYSTKQQAINHYRDIMTDDTNHTLNKVDSVVWVNSERMQAILNDQSLLLDAVAVKLPPAIEADWDTNDTKEFDRLLYKILFDKPKLH